MKNEVLLYGPASNQEVEELTELLNDCEVVKLETKSQGLEEVIQIVFHDFNILTFSRDFVLGALLTGSLTQIKRIISYFKGKRKKVNAAIIDVQVKSTDKQYSLYITATPDNIDLVVELANQRMGEIDLNADNGCMMQIKMTTDNKTIEITKI